MSVIGEGIMGFLKQQEADNVRRKTNPAGTKKAVGVPNPYDNAVAGAAGRRPTDVKPAPATPPRGSGMISDYIREREELRQNGQVTTYQDQRPFDRVDNDRNPVTTGLGILDGPERKLYMPRPNPSRANPEVAQKAGVPIMNDNPPAEEIAPVPSSSVGGGTQGKDIQAEDKGWWQKIAEAGQNKGGTNYWDTLAKMGAVMSQNKAVGDNAFLQDLAAGVGTAALDDKTQRQERSASAAAKQKMQIEQRKAQAAELTARAAWKKAGMPTGKLQEYDNIFRQESLEVLPHVVSGKISPEKARRIIAQRSLARMYPNAEEKALAALAADPMTMGPQKEAILARIEAMSGPRRIPGQGKTWDSMHLKQLK